MSDKVFDPHFLRYAGAPPAKQMFKQQRLARAAAPPEVVEKPADSPDRPSNISRSMREGDVSKVLAVDLPRNATPAIPEADAWSYAPRPPREEAAPRPPDPTEAHATAGVPAPEADTGRIVRSNA